MKIIVIGGTGHIGTFLVPRLVVSGHDVVVITRGQQQPYHLHPTWKEVRQVVLDRSEAEKEGTFGKAIRELKPDVVMDMLCFTLQSAQQLVEALKGDRAGQHSIRVNDQFRVCFRWTDAGAEDVEIVDYH